MKFDSVFSTLWKLFLCVVVFIIGMLINRILLPLLGIQSLAKLLGMDARILVSLLVLFSVVLTFLAAQISRRLRVNWFLRGIIVVEFLWILELAGVCVLSFLLLPSLSIVSIITSILLLVNFLLPNLLACGFVVFFFSPIESIPFHLTMKNRRLAPRIQTA